MTAEEYLQLGNECRQRGDWQKNISNEVMSADREATGKRP